MSTTTPTSVGEALPDEIARVTQLIAIYAALDGGVGGFAIALMQRAIKSAAAAMVAGDAAAMVRAYDELRGFKE